MMEYVLHWLSKEKKWNDRNTSWTDKCCEAWIPMKWDQQQHSDTQNYIRVVQHKSDTEDSPTSTAVFFSILIAEYEVKF